MQCSRPLSFTGIIFSNESHKRHILQEFQKFSSPVLYGDYLFENEDEDEDEDDDDDVLVPCPLRGLSFEKLIQTGGE